MLEDKLDRIQMVINKVMLAAIELIGVRKRIM